MLGRPAMMAAWLFLQVACLVSCLKAPTVVNAASAPAIAGPADAATRADTTKPVVYEAVEIPGIALPAFSAPKLSSKPTARAEYSAEFAKRVLVPAMGGTVVTAELGKAGFPDLYVVVPGARNHLLHNNGNGTFSEITEKAGVGGTSLDLNAAFADYDHSGKQSLFVCGWGGVHVYHASPDGSYVDVTEKTGIQNKPAEVDSDVVFFDADGDGFPDLVVTGYTELSTAPNRETFVFPNHFPDARTRLYHNRRDGTFKEVTEESGLGVNPGRTRKAIAADLNNDGKIDLLLLRDNKPPALFINLGNGKFEDRTSQADEDLILYAFVDGEAVDLQGSGKMDLALWSAMANRVLLNRGQGKFEEIKMVVITQPPHAFGFHGLVADLNGDGMPDLLAADATGHWRLLLNRGGKFEEAPFVLSSDHSLSPDQFVFMTAARWQRGAGMSLLGLTNDGRLQVFENKSPAVVHIPTR